MAEKKNIKKIKKKLPDDYVFGRPTDYRPEFCQQAREMLKQGFSKIEIAAAFDVNRRTMDDWAVKYPDFNRTINEDIDLSEAWWTQQGRENLATKEFNSCLYEINMMNRFGWMKKAQQNHDVSVKHEDALKDLE